MRGADEHFDEVVVEGVVELALEGPFELGVVQITRMQIEVVGVHRHAWILELDDQFNAITFRASIEIEQWVLVETQLSENAIQALIRGHRNQNRF